jgi:predicted nucleic acid-binding protein
MNYLLDTCVLSEFTQRKPDQRVVEWLDSLDEEKLFISVITVG